MSTTKLNKKSLASGASDLEFGRNCEPILKIRPPGRWAPLALGEIWNYRDLLLALAVRDVKLRYKQTALGVAWVILQPLIGALIFTFVFSFLADMPTEGVPPLLFMYAGLLGWQAFNSTVNKASECVVANSQLVSKVYFPRLILPFSTVLSSLIDFGVGLVVIAVLMAVYGIPPGPGILLMPVILALFILAAVGLGLYTSALMVTYRDLRYAIPVLMQLLTYASPVGYSLQLVDRKIPAVLRPIYFANPLVELLQAFRWSILGHGEVHLGWMAYSSGMAALIFVVGAFAFKRMEKRFADII
jgi:lipopolysaccharide transport system permease protein